MQDFIFGGMENTSATTQTDLTLHDERAHLDFSSDFLVAHEAVHQWFGDQITCREWSHGWLNEGFATYFEARWQEHHRGVDDYLYEILLMARGYLSEGYQRPIVERRYNQPVDIFDHHLYEKGGLVLHMLRRELGDEAFFRFDPPLPEEIQGPQRTDRRPPAFHRRRDRPQHGLVLRSVGVRPRPSPIQGQVFMGTMNKVRPR